MEFADVFKPDAFAVTTMTAAINKMPFLPGRLGQMGLFDEHGIATPTAAIEWSNGALALVATSKRGAPASPPASEKRKIVQVRAPHLRIPDAVLADEVFGVRAFGMDGGLYTVERKRDEKLLKCSNHIDLTLEYHRLGAIQGIVLDADGVTEVLNVFTEFGISQPAEVDFDLDNGSPASGALRKKCDGITRSMASALGGIPFKGIHALCGDAFWDDLVAHQEMRETYKYQEGAALREGTAFSTVKYGNITWENYRGSGSVAIGTDKAKFVAVGVPDLFQTLFAPADYIETVNSEGLPKYAKAKIMDFERGYEIEVQSNPINLCTRPETLLSAKRT